MHKDAHASTWGIDVVVFSPTQRKPIEIQHGSDFGLRDFLWLEDKQLNRALKRVGDLPNDVPRGTFSEAMVVASIFVQGITLSHDLDRKALFRVIQYHSLPGFLYYLDHSEGKFLNLRQRVLLLYGCMKILANRMDYASELKASR